jgi:hypothetical protein
MKLKALLMGWLLAGAVDAKELERPLIVGHIANQAGGQITLTMRTSKKCAQQEAVFAYIRDPGGRISLIGCWKMQGEDIFVFWDDGDVFSYPLDSLQMTDDWLRYMEQEAAREKGATT